MILVVVCLPGLDIWSKKSFFCSDQMVHFIHNNGYLGTKVLVYHFFLILIPLFIMLFHLSINCLFLSYKSHTPYKLSPILSMSLVNFLQNNTKGVAESIEFVVEETGIFFFVFIFIVVFCIPEETSVWCMYMAGKNSWEWVNLYMKERNKEGISHTYLVMMLELLSQNKQQLFVYHGGTPRLV